MKIWSYSWHLTADQAKEWVKECRKQYDHIDAVHMEVTTKGEHKASVYGKIKEDYRWSSTQCLF